MSDFKEENSYKNILKRLSAFGGVQIFNIIIGLLRGKFVALFLGPAGMGISSLYVSSTSTIQQLSSLGLNLAVVKEIASIKDNKPLLHRRLMVCVRLLLLTALLGTIVCGAGALWWSELTFGNSSHTVAYILLSSFVAFAIASAGFLALLQGLGEVKKLAKASLVGGLTGLVAGVPLYYFFGVAGIVPAIIIIGLTSCVFYYISYKKSTKFLKTITPAVISREENRKFIRHLISLGFILFLGSVIGQLVSYAINLFIRMDGSVSDVGLYQGASSLTNQYVGLIISALALDYFPRLSACASDRLKMKEVINRQIEIVMTVATPLLIILIISAPLIIKILLTDSFVSIIPLMRWLGLGMLIQVLAFPFGYIYVACDDRKAYIWLECIGTNIIWLTCSVVFYYFYGLDGLGISLLVRNAIDFFINIIVIRRRYDYKISPSCLRTIVISVLLASVAFVCSFIQETSLSYGLMSFFLIIALIISFRNLRTKLKTEG